MAEASLLVGAEARGFADFREHLRAIPGRADIELLTATEAATATLLDHARATINRSNRPDSERPANRQFATHETIESSVDRDPGGRIRGVVGSDDPIAGILEEGSQAHTIEARYAKALRFRIGGRVLFRKRVEHPGTKPYRWLERSGLLADAEARADYDRALERTFEPER